MTGQALPSVNRVAAQAAAENPLLMTALQMAVPLEIDRLRSLPDEALEGVRALADLTLVSTDAMLFGGKGAAGAFTAHVRAFALLALLAEGGVDFCELHWCAIPGCRAVSRFAHADDAPPRGPTDPSARRSVDVVPVTGDLL